MPSQAPNVARQSSGVQIRADRLRAELDRIRPLIAAIPSIRQVVVFGSVAAGQTSEWSDLDVMVVEETDRPFVERALRLARVVQPRVGVQFLVYTPQELQALARRTFVAIEILQKGKVLPMNPREDARRWLAFADEDLRVAELALRSEIFNQACFHSQQCVEKCLKACLAAAGDLLPRTHLIADLWRQLTAGAQDMLKELGSDLAVLDQFYVPTRYPDALPGSLPEGLPQKQDADEAVAIARRCYQHVAEWVG